MKNIILFISTLLILASCQENTSKIKEELGLTPKEALDIGQMHNDFLDVAIPKNNYNSRISSDALRESFLSQEVEVLTIKKKENLMDQVVAYTQEDLKIAIGVDSYLYIQIINQILLEKDNLDEISGGTISPNG